MAIPRCPYCNAQGVNQLEAKVVGFFVLVFCKGCGAIHGVVPKPVSEQPPATVTTPEPELNLHPIPGKQKPQPPKAKKQNPQPVNKASRLKPEEAQARAAAGLSPKGTMYRIIRNVDDEE